MSDPRHKGFNYGAPLRNDTLPALYHDLVRTSERLNTEATVASGRAWELEMLLRDARHACNEIERDAAIDALRDWVRENDASFGGTAAGDYAKLATIGGGRC